MEKHSAIDFRARGKPEDRAARGEFRAAIHAYRRDLSKLESLQKSEKRRCQQLVAKIEQSAERVQAVCVALHSKRARID